MVPRGHPQHARHDRTEEVSTEIRELVRHWEHTAKGRVARNHYSIPLGVESAVRLAALHEIYPRRSVEGPLGELVGAIPKELEANFPHVKGSQVVATDEQGDPLYEDVGPTPRFLSLSRKHLHELVA